MSLDMFGDKEVNIFARELYFLRRIAESSHDLLSGQSDPHFALLSGGVDALKAQHRKCVYEYETWLAEGE